MGETLSIEGAQILSGWAHVAALAAFMLLARAAPHADDAESEAERIALMRGMLEAAVPGESSSETMTVTATETATATLEADSGGEGAPSRSASPRAFDAARPPSPTSSRATGPSSGVGVRGAPASSSAEAAGFGILGLLGSRPAGKNESWAKPSDDGAYGAGFFAQGFGLSSSGFDGGSGDSAMLLGGFGSLAHRGPAESGAGGTPGWGLLGGHSVRAAAAMCGCDEASVSGRTPPEIIQRIVRQNMGRFRYCYKRALDRNPTLQGRVAARFLIARDGTVGYSAEQPEETDFPDAEAVRCIVQAFGALTFPPPEGGTVTVIYPLSLSPTG